MIQLQYLTVNDITSWSMISQLLLNKYIKLIIQWINFFTSNQKNKIFLISFQTVWLSLNTETTKYIEALLYAWRLRRKFQQVKFLISMSFLWLMINCCNCLFKDFNQIWQFYLFQTKFRTTDICKLTPLFSSLFAGL